MQPILFPIVEYGTNGIPIPLLGALPLTAVLPDATVVPVGIAPPVLFGVKLALWRNLIAARSVTINLVDPIFPTSPPPQPLTMFQLKGMTFNRPRVVPQPSTKLFISGITKDSTGAVLANCTVTLYRTVDNVVFESVVSGASGNYSFSAIGLSETYYVVAYKAGSPDVSGTTVNTLVGI